METAKLSSGHGHTKERIGVVVRAKTPKTIVVEVERLTQHPRYNKVIRKRKRWMVHDEKSTAKVGDKVKIVESRPISKMKCWRVAEVLKVE
ncbi:MAG: 30S ribosomal protein S17 [Candidatus Omnitrophica bacterium]|nr:30S ribosomal protein S17 [Candidatus Omnitrophota bacterium]